jgi:small GTP-binding protein
MDEQKPELLYKVLVIGEAGTGKTCLIRRYVHNSFTSHAKATVGVDFAIKILTLHGKSVTLQLWDIAGQEGTRQMTRVYYQAALGAAVVCDIAKPESFEAAVSWKRDLDSKVFLGSTCKSVPCVLIVNKCDLGPNLRSEDEMVAFCKEHGFLTWFETSAKTNTNVEAPFMMLAEEILKTTSGAEVEVDSGDDPKGKRGRASSGHGRLKLRQEEGKGKAKSCPC